MAYYSDNSFTTFQGRALRGDSSLKLPAFTLALGMLAALAVGVGALNMIPVKTDMFSELGEIEYLTGSIGE